MTTIAWCGKILAADGQSTINGNRRLLSNSQKIHVATAEDNWTIEGKKISAFGMAGRPSALNLVKETLTTGLKHDTKITEKDTSFAIIAVAETGEAFKWQVTNDSKKQLQHVDLLPVTGPMAIGSGGVFAEAVLSIGMSAVDAVKAAMKLDVMSGGEISYWEAWKGNLSTAIFIEQTPHPLQSLYEELVQTLNQPIGSDEDVKAQLSKMKEIIAKPEYKDLH